MKLNEIAEDVIVGQIMTRVVSDDEDLSMKEVYVLNPKAINEGVIDRSVITKAMLKKEIDIEKITRPGDVVIKLSTPYDSVFISAEDQGYAVPSFCAIIRVKEYDARFLTAYLNTSYARELLKSKVAGTTRPMIKISDLRELEIPDEYNKEIGEAYQISAQKKALLREMIETETEITEAIVLKYVKGTMKRD